MPLRTYLVSVGLTAGLTLLCTLPIVLVALWRSRTRRWKLVYLESHTREPLRGTPVTFDLGPSRSRLKRTTFIPLRVGSRP